jgi:hypothetical protein
MGRYRSETTTLVFAVCVAVTLGVACGVWINARLTAAASKTPHAASRLMPAATPGQTEPAPSGEAQPVSDDSRRQAADDDPHQTAPADGGESYPEDSEAPAQTQTQSLASAPDAAHKDRTAPAAVAPAAREANPPEKSPAARVEGREAKAEPRPRAGGAAPCAPYASAGALTLRGGGAATLVVGGPGEPGRVAVTTPDWADIAVFSEGRAGGNGWVRYSVRSVSRRPGVYALHFKTPCGSQRIPVTVTRP